MDKAQYAHYTAELYCMAFQYAEGITTNITVFTGAMRTIMKDQIWQSGWADKVSGELISTPSLKEFIERRVPKGIGQTIEWTYAALKSADELGEKDAGEAIQLLNEQIKIETGKTARTIYERKVAQAVPELPEPAKGGRGKKTPPNRSSLNSGSTSANATLARLKRDHPKLAEHVVNGELSANQAAIQAGFRKKPVRRCPQCGHEW